MFSVLRSHRLLLLLLALTAAVYSLSLGNGFVNLDDTLLVTENPHVLHPSLAHIIYVFTHFDPELYVPFTLLSYQLETWTLGLAPWHFHLLNLLLHLGSIILAYALLLALTKSKNIALLTVALFALHPVNSEAVLWISGRKDLLAGFFVLATLCTYLTYKEKGGRRLYAAALLLALAALLSKVSAVTLPLLLLLLDYARGSAISKKSIRELLPFFFLATIVGIVAVIGKSGIEREISDLALMMFRTTGFALQMFIFPANLSVVHLLETIGFGEPGFLSSILVVTLLSVLFYKIRALVPLAWTGWLFFLITLAPSFVQYEHGNRLLYAGSERYLYLPSIGLSLLLSSVFLSPLFITRLSRLNKKLLAAIVCILLLNFAAMTLLRSFDWKDSITFNEDILKKEPNDPIAHHNLASALEERGETSDAEMHYRKAIDLKPTFFDAEINLGALLILLGQSEEGLTHLRAATALRPDSFRGFFNLGVAYQKLERWNDALLAYDKSIDLEPNFTESYRNLATIYGKLGRFEDAVRAYATLATLDPSFAERFATLQSEARTHP